MPVYIYQNPETGEVKEIVQLMDEEHSYYENNIKWKRLFTIPKMSVDTRIDPHSSKDFVKKNRSKRGKFGDLLDQSAELAEKRKEKEGVDSVKQKFYEDYARERKGQRHPQEKREKLKDAIKDVADIEF